MVKQTKKKSTVNSKKKATKASTKPKTGLVATCISKDARNDKVVTVLHCDHPLLKDYTGWLGEGGEFLDDDMIEEMVAKLEKKDADKDPVFRTKKASKMCKHTKFDAVLYDFLTVFGTVLVKKEKKTVTACVNIFYLFC